jgi:hypothetical protein
MWDLIRYVVELLVAFSVLIVPFVWAEEWLWAGFFATVAAVLIGFEIFSCLTGSDISLSNRMWVLDATNPQASFRIICGLVLFWSYLCMHLLWRF